MSRSDDSGAAPGFFAELGLPAPDFALEVPAGNPVVEIARILTAFEPLLLAAQPDLVLVVGDDHSALACALAAVKLRIPVAHVEAGLRSRNRRRPRELNRLLTDRISAWLFTSAPDADQSLLAEGYPPARIHPVGSVRIDSVLHGRPAAAASPILDTLGLAPRSYAVLALDRPENADEDDPEPLRAALAAVSSVAAEIPIVCAVDPRLRRQLPVEPNGFRVPDALGYLDTLRLVDQARLVLTDSGGIQETTTQLGVPCLTLTDETAHPITVGEGTNLVVGLDPQRVAAESRKILRGEAKSGRTPARWDGQAAERIVAVLAQGPPSWSLDAESAP
jgi:UDP-N-acetylglucosamine 2-epimerase (non-hydrolysing)